jgi:hypothetical protein
VIINNGMSANRATGTIGRKGRDAGSTSAEGSTSKGYMAIGRPLLSCVSVMARW